MCVPAETSRRPEGPVGEQCPHVFASGAITRSAPVTVQGGLLTRRIPCCGGSGSSSRRLFPSAITAFSYLVVSPATRTCSTPKPSYATSVVLQAALRCRIMRLGNALRPNAGVWNSSYFPHHRRFKNTPPQPLSRPLPAKCFLGGHSSCDPGSGA